MAFNGVELLRLQFSRAIDQTFEHFLDSWSLPQSEERVLSGPIGAEQPVEVPVNISA